MRLSPPSAVVPSETMRSPSRLRLGAGAERHGVEVRREQQPRPWPGAGQIDDQVARLGRHGNALVGVVEADGGGRHADLLQRVADRGGDGRLLAGDAFDGEEPHQMVLGRLRRREGSRWLLMASVPHSRRSESRSVRLMRRAAGSSQTPGQAEQLPDRRRGRPEHEHPHRRRAASATRPCRRRRSCRISGRSRRPARNRR